MPSVLSALAAFLSLVPLAQEPRAVPGPGDRVIEVELEDIGGETGESVARIEHVCEHPGTLHAWVAGGRDLILRVEDDEGELLAEGRSSNEAPTPYVALDVAAGAPLHLTVVEPGSGAAAPGPLRLHLATAQETERTRAAASDAEGALQLAQDAVDEGRPEEGRGVLAESVAALLATDGARWSEDVGRMLAHTGNAAGRIGALDVALEATAAARAHFERTRPEDHPDVLGARVDLALLLRQTGDFEGAREIQEGLVAVHARSPVEDSPELISAELNLAGTLYRLGDLPRARDLFQHVVDVRRRTLPEDSPMLLGAQQNLAIVLWDLGDLEGARALEEHVLAVQERSLPEDHPALLSGRLNLGATLKNLGELEAARTLYERALAGYERTLPDDHPDLQRARSNLAVLLGELDELEAARALSEHVLEVFERTRPEGHPELVLAQENLAVLLQNTGDVAGARALFESVLAARERDLPPDHPELLRARTNFALALEAAGDFEAARALAARVLADLENALPEEHPLVLHARSFLASAMKDLGELEDARALEAEVLEVRERTLPEGHPDILRSRNDLAVTLVLLGEPERGRALLESVLETRTRTLPPEHLHLTATRANLLVTLCSLGDRAAAHELAALLIEGMQQRALATLRLAPREAREALLFDSLPLGLALYSGSEAEAGLSRPVFELVETRRAVTVEVPHLERVAQTDSRLAELRARALRASAAVDAVVQRAATADLDREAFTRAIRERDAAERALREALHEQGGRTGAVRLERVAAALPADGAAIGYLRYDRWTLDEGDSAFAPSEPCLLAHVVLPDGSLTRVDLGPARPIEELVTRERAALGKPLQRGVTVLDAPATSPDLEGETGRALREALLDPILAVLGDGVKKLAVCPDDVVFLLPLDALPLDEGRVGDAFAVYLLPSMAELTDPRPPSRKPPGLLALGGADFDAAGRDAGAATPRGTRGPFQQLPQTRAEIETVSELFRRSFEAEPVVLAGAEATSAALLEKIEDARYVHLATHGWFAPESVPSRDDSGATAAGLTRLTGREAVSGLAPLALCGLALAGANQPVEPDGRRPGILTAESLARLSLGGCELAVLSACETNVGIRRAGQGIQSLQSALHAAGARWAITTLWKVDDVYARELMERFYAHLWEDGRTVPAALWAAKRELRAAGAPASAWAPWVLSGAIE